MNEKKNIVIAVLATVCLMSMLFAWRAYGVKTWPYNPWWDVTDDGKIDIQDLARVSGAFGTNGQNITKASIAYDSGWLNLTGVNEQYCTLVHSLNATDVLVDARGHAPGWNRTYGGNRVEASYSLAETSDRGYALAGSTNSSGAGGDDFWLVKTDAWGNLLWNKTYGGALRDVAYSVVQTSDEGCALAGYTLSYGAGNRAFYLVKTDSTGNMQWNKTYGGTANDMAYSVVQTSDGGYALAGSTGGDIWMVKTDSVGNAEWNKTYAAKNAIDQVARSVVQTGDGGYAIGGSTESFGAGGWDFWLIRTDASGNTIWNQTYGGLDHDVANSMVKTKDGGFALAGYTFPSGDETDFWLVKTDGSGNQLWNRTYGGHNDEIAESLVQTSDGEYALAGWTLDLDTFRSNVFFVKTDSNGNMLWNRTYGEWEAHSVVQTSDGGFALAGEGPPGDFLLIKTDVECGLAWVSPDRNSIRIARGGSGVYWNYIRVRISKIREYPPKP